LPPLLASVPSGSAIVTDDQVAQVSAKAQTQRAAIVGRKHAATVAFSGHSGSSATAAVLRKRFLQSLNRAAGLDGYG